MGIRVFIVRYEKKCEKSFFSKTGCTSESLATRMSRKFQLPNNRMARLYFLSYNDLAVLTLQLPTCFTPVTHFGESPVVSCLLMHTLDQFFPLSHTQPLHYSYLKIGFLNSELQENLAWNKANT